MSGHAFEGVRGIVRSLTRRDFGKVCGLGLVVAAVAGCAPLQESSSPPADLVVLVTPEEAALPDAPAPPPGPRLERRTFGLRREEAPHGPEIVVESPETGKTYRPPVPIDVRFVSRKDAPIDPDSLRVTYLKFWGIDITDRVKEYLVEDRIQVPNAKLPSGRHRIRVSISDQNGATTTQDFSLQIE